MRGSEFSYSIPARVVPDNVQRHRSRPTMKSVKGRPGINSHQPRQLALHYRQDPVITLSHQILGIFSDNESSQRDVAVSDSAGKFGR